LPTSEEKEGERGRRREGEKMEGEKEGEERRHTGAKRGSQIRISLARSSGQTSFQKFDHGVTFPKNEIKMIHKVIMQSLKKIWSVPKFLKIP
jgi:hypothetical protein